MNSLPLVQTDDRNINQIQRYTKTALDPLLKNPVLNGNLLTSVSLSSGSNTISHGLNRNLQGWIMVRVRSSATFYDTQDSNPSPNLTLTLVASANVVCDIYVF